MQDSFSVIVQEVLQKTCFINCILAKDFEKWSMAEINKGFCGFFFASSSILLVFVFRERGACLSSAVRGWLLGPGARPMCVLQDIPTWHWVCRALWYLSGVRGLLCLCSCINKKLQIVFEVSQLLVCLHQLFLEKSLMDGFVGLLSCVIKQL